MVDKVLNLLFVLFVNHHYIIFFLPLVVPKPTLNFIEILRFEVFVLTLVVKFEHYSVVNLDAVHFLLPNFQLFADIFKSSFSRQTKL